MERIQALIDKLVQQQAEHASAAQLLMTVQQLQSELLQHQSANGRGSSRVAVTLPVNLRYQEETFPAETARPAVARTAEAPPAPQPVRQPAPVEDVATPAYHLRRPYSVEEPL